MKSKMSLTMLGAVLALTGSASALPPPLPTARSASPAAEPSLAQIEFKNTTHDVGKVFDHDPQEFTFDFTNTGEEELVITKVQSSCGCTAGALEKTEYAPGESGSIEVTFNPKGKKGDQRRQLTVYSNDKGGREIVLTVTGSVTQLVSIDPAILSMGSVAKGESAVKFITVTGRTEDFEVTRVTAGNLEVFSTRVIGTEAIEELSADGEKGETLRRSTIEVTLKAGAKVGRVDDRLSIRTNDPRRPIVTAQVIATVMGDIAVTPPRISIGRPELGQTFEREFTVASRSGEAFEIKEIKFANGAVRIEFDATPVNPEKPDTYKVRMKATAARVHPRLRQEIVIVTNVSGEEEIRIPISGVVTTRP